MQSKKILGLVKGCFKTLLLSAHVPNYAIFSRGWYTLSLYIFKVSWFILDESMKD